jgi:hypothetical protein
MLKKILIVLAVAVVLAVAYVASRPSTFVVTRSTVVPAPVTAIFPRVVDFKAWDAWSPWAKLDPAMKVDFTGAPGTVGHSYHWVGNDKVGEGRMTITEVVPDRLARIKLEFIKPWAQVSTTDFGFVPDGTGTKVTWTMRGDQDLVGKAFSVFWDIDKAVGPDFEKGLAKLREVAKE